MGIRDWTVDFNPSICTMPADWTQVSNVFDHRVNVLQNIPVPYRIDLFTHLQLEHLPRLQVLFCNNAKKWRDWVIPLDSTQYTTLPGLSIRRPGSEQVAYINPSITDLMDRSHCDVAVILGYASPTCWLAMEKCRNSGIPYVLWSESTAHEESALRRVSRRLIVRAVSGASAFLATSPRAARYLRSHGADPERVSIVPNAPDISRFLNFPGGNKSRDHPTIVFVGQFIARKGLVYLVKAFSELTEAFPHAQLHLAGSGPQETSLRHLVDRLGIRPNVHFHGFVQPSGMRRVYASADIFVLPSLQETFGTVVVEAMASRLAVVVTSVSGTVDFLVLDNRTGLVVSPGNEASLTEALMRLAEDKGLRRRIAAQGQRLVSKVCSLERMSSQFIRSLALATSDLDST